ncbi:alpha/beta hydrolase [Roseivirga echinicomitans]|uniref:Hydrolase n=1 Tax=Roseivirga echinicomitans TaxID=296218 RepID=A0A150XJT3_9BACT|nr:alpha/beta fold hydrolase [Roseivirga echinicomitans]KYG78989.1 hydrolase [Roseivirga echinicomitans]
MRKYRPTEIFKTYLLISVGFLLLNFGCQSPNTQSTTLETTRAELIQNTVLADAHPIAVWSKSNPNATEAILLVHGRTWSAIPDFDLQVEGEDLSLMDGLVERGYAVYAIDGRGYGATPRDSTGWFTPDRAAKDIAVVLQWMAQQKIWENPPHLFGWSMGSTMSQLTAQRHPELISSLTLFGYWKDSDQIFPDEPSGAKPAMSPTTAEAAASDFITPGSISQKAIDAYVKAALKADPVRVDLNRYDQFNELDPAKVTVPTLILQGELDPIGPTATQAKLFTRLGTSHKQWTVIPGGDHAAFMETPRAYFINSLVNFLAGVSQVRK